MSQKWSAGEAEVSIGFAADPGGAGVAYGVLRSNGRESLIRVPFQVRRATGSEGREVGYAALRAVADAVRERFTGDVRFLIADESLALDLEQRRTLPTALTIPYVALGCSLNRFTGTSVAATRSSQIGDLTARARAEVSLHIAA